MKPLPTLPPATVQALAALAERYARYTAQVEADREPGLLYHRLAAWCREHDGALPPRPVAITIARRLGIDMRRWRQKMRGGGGRMTGPGARHPMVSLQEPVGEHGLRREDTLAGGDGRAEVDDGRQVPSRALLLCALTSMPVLVRSAVEAVLLAGEPKARVAADLGVAPATVASLLNEGLARLREYILAEWPELAESWGAEALSAREREIAERVAAGQHSRQIAQELGLSVRTVDNHRNNIYRKTGCRNSAQLTLWALSAGMPAERAARRQPRAAARPSRGAASTRSTAG